MNKSICRCSGRVSQGRTAGSHIFLPGRMAEKYSIDRIIKNLRDVQAERQAV